LPSAIVERGSLAAGARFSGPSVVVERETSTVVTAHVVDVGGRGYGADGESVYKESTQIPTLEFAERGQVDAELIHILNANVREANQVVGDFYSLAACKTVGHKRLTAIMEEAGLASLHSLGEFIFSRTRTATLQRIATLPKGRWSNVLMTDGYDCPVRLACVVTIGDGVVNVDFAGSDGVAKHGINVPIIYTRDYACYALKCVVAPDIPNNWASLRAFANSSPENILNAPCSAPVSVRHVIGHLLPDLVLGALAQALPGRVLAEGAAAVSAIRPGAIRQRGPMIWPGDM
jgi:N-methylhydantoinase B